MKFEWDEKKNIKNKQKHGVSFAEASTIFESKYFTFDDGKHSKKESRFIAIGRSIRRRILFVCYCIRIKNKIRIISARKATKKERIKFYEKCN